MADTFNAATATVEIATATRKLTATQKNALLDSLGKTQQEFDSMLGNLSETNYNTIKEMLEVLSGAEKKKKDDENGDSNEDKESIVGARAKVISVIDIDSKDPRYPFASQIVTYETNGKVSTALRARKSNRIVSDVLLEVLNVEFASDAKYQGLARKTTRIRVDFKAIKKDGSEAIGDTLVTVSQLASVHKKLAKEYFPSITDAEMTAVIGLADPAQRDTAAIRLFTPAKLVTKSADKHLFGYGSLREINSTDIDGANLGPDTTTFSLSTDKGVMELFDNGSQSIDSLQKFIVDQSKKDEFLLLSRKREAEVVAIEAENSAKLNKSKAELAGAAASFLAAGGTMEEFKALFE